MSQTILLTQNEGAFLLQMGAVVYQDCLYKINKFNDYKPGLDMFLEFINQTRDRVKLTLCHNAERTTFCILGSRINDNNIREGYFLDLSVNEYPKYKSMRPWWVMVQRAWREMRKTRQECFETFVLGTHARLGADSVVVKFPVDLLGLVYDQLLPSEMNSI
jgi:hypothetical protein